MAKQLIEAPENCVTLGYIEAYDAPLNSDYAYVAYQDGESVRVKGYQTAGAVFESEAMRLQSRAAGAQGKPYFIWGYNLEPTDDDVRQVEFRMHVAGGKPSEIEMLLRMRLFDGKPDEPVSVRFPWPL
jgi:hypothetical protein